MYMVEVNPHVYGGLSRAFEVSTQITRLSLEKPMYLPMEGMTPSDGIPLTPIAPKCAADVRARGPGLLRIPCQPQLDAQGPLRLVPWGAARAGGGPLGFPVHHLHLAGHLRGIEAIYLRLFTYVLRSGILRLWGSLRE